MMLNLRPERTEQLATLWRAKALGLRVVLVGDREYSTAAGLADEVWLVDTFDAESALAEILSMTETDEHGVDGIVTWSDRDVELLASIAAKLGLPGLSPEAAALVRNKYKMRERVGSTDPGLVPQFRRVVSSEDLAAGLDEIGGRCVLKPTGASGSRGIFLLDAQADATRSFAAAVEATAPSRDKSFRYHEGEYVLEEYIDGPEYSVEGICQSGQVIVAAITEKRTTDDFKLEFEQIVPAAVSPEQAAALLDATRRVCRSLALENCAFHLEAKLTRDGVKLIEVAGRPGGDLISSHLVSLATGWSLSEQLMRCAIGLPVAPPPALPPARHAGIRKFVASNPGTVRDVQVPAILPPAVLEVHVGVDVGSAVRLPPESFTEQLWGYAYGVAESRAELVDALDSVDRDAALDIG